ncbi:MAG TPA: hypothetical protein VEC08_03545, partial [Nitrososphaerales archaeon]|nr:hypothetical protein [Nitrososphaerales archaeon]
MSNSSGRKCFSDAFFPHRGQRRKGVVSKKVNEERKRTPDLDDLKRLNMLLIERKVSPVDATRAANVLSQLEDEGVNLSTEGLKECLELAKRYGDKTQEAINELRSVMALEKKEGKPIEKISEEARALQATLDDLQEKKIELGRAIKELEDRLGEVREYE